VSVTADEKFASDQHVSTYSIRPPTGGIFTNHPTVLAASVIEIDPYLLIS
jgi:hypothetical protein